jgi:hypothetical protein
VAINVTNAANGMDRKTEWFAMMLALSG